jgi:hypothetical protein
MDVTHYIESAILNLMPPKLEETARPWPRRDGLSEILHPSWWARLSTEEKIRLVPPSDFAKPGSPGHNVQLKQYFRENIWP